MERRTKLLIILCILLACLVAFSLFVFSNYSITGVVPDTGISFVVDGDTLVLDSGEYVRLIGINAPELGDPYYSESRAYLESLILGKDVTFEKDLDNRDPYGRFLRYVYVDDLLVNYELVRQGYAVPLFIEPNFEHKSVIEEAYSACLVDKLRLCA